MINRMPSKVWNEIIYPFPNFNGAAVEVWEWISNLIVIVIVIVIVKRGPWVLVNPSKSSGAYMVIITYPFSNFNGCTVQVCEWISNFTPDFIVDEITYPYWD